MDIDILLNQREGCGAVIVSHPDDETLWCGGMVLERPDWNWTIVTTCRASDSDRAPRFRNTLRRLRASGVMADLDDGPLQTPLPHEETKRAIRRMMPGISFDLVLTHGPLGEYTRHIRHEECCAAVLSLWRDGGLRTKQLWMFAFEDGGKTRLRRANRDADVRLDLPSDVWRGKKRIVTEIYGFLPDSWEARVVPDVEAFFCFETPETAIRFVEKARSERGPC